MRIPKNLWSNPDFSALTRGAQWLYFTRKMSGQKSAFNLEETLTWAAGLCPDEVLDAAEELRSSPFSHALNKRTTKRQKITLELRRQVYSDDGWKCVYCSDTRNLEIDHIVPLSKGGTEDRSNLQTLCAPCNRKKGATVYALVQS